MQIFIIKNWSTKEEIRIEAINWDIDKYQHNFYCVNDMKTSIVTQSYSCRYWDLIDRYDKRD